MKHTLLHVAKYYYPAEGGIETVTRYMAEGLTDFNNVIICFSHDGLTRMDTINGIKVYRIAPSVKVSSQDVAFTYYSYLKKLLHEFQPDIVVLHCPNPFLYPIVQKLTPKYAKLVLLWHSDILGKGSLYKGIRLFEKKILQKSDMILVTSPNYIHPSSPVYDYRDKVEVVQNGIIDDDFKFRADDGEAVANIRTHYGNKKIIFFVGRHAQYKGIDRLIEAERYIQSDCIILIGGRGPETESLKAMTQSKRIKFIGRIPNEELRHYYYAADIFAFCSITKQEAFGIALAEAMYCGCVPVTFTIEGSGVNWVSLKGVTGEEVPLNDTKAYAEAIDKLLTQPDLYMQYAIAARKRIQDVFTCQRSNIVADKLFKNLLDEA